MSAESCARHYVVRRDMADFHGRSLGIVCSINFELPSQMIILEKIFYKNN